MDSTTVSTLPFLPPEFALALTAMMSVLVGGISQWSFERLQLAVAWLKNSPVIVKSLLVPVVAALFAFTARKLGIVLPDNLEALTVENINVFYAAASSALIHQAVKSKSPRRR